MAKHVSLRVSLSMAFILLVLLSGLLVGAGSWVNTNKLVKQGIAGRLYDITGLAARILSTEDHSRLTDRGMINSDEHKRLIEGCRHIREVNPDVRFIYTMRADSDGTIRFIIDSDWDPAPGADNEGCAHFGDIYETVDPEMAAFVANPRGIKVDTDYYTDEWGTWMTGLVPLYRADGSLEAVIGIDIAAEKILTAQKRHTLILAIIILALVLPVGFAGYFVSRQIARPIMALTGDMEKIQTLQLDGSTGKGSRIREVVDMQLALENMKSGLRSFRKYVPADLVNELLLEHQEAVLGATKQELSVFFSDIKDFTTISESLDPETLAECLGEYFNGMTGTLQRHEATVDKFIGDAIMAFWNAPRSIPDHAMYACEAALSCRDFLAGAAQNWSEQGRPLFTTRIGIHTGEAVVGNIGYSERLSYTAIGDTVNLASRLEGLNKLYGTSIIISEATRDAAGDGYLYRLLDIVRVKGKSRGVSIYELAGRREGAEPERLARLSAWETAMEYYRNRNWTAALEGLETCAGLSEIPDEACRFLSDRVRSFIKNPPPADWNGVVVLREK
jgi:adenylate cyclase